MVLLLILELRGWLPPRIQRDRADRFYGTAALAASAASPEETGLGMLLEVLITSFVLLCLLLMCCVSTLQHARGTRSTNPRHSHDVKQGWHRTRLPGSGGREFEGS